MKKGLECRVKRHSSPSKSGRGDSNPRRPAWEDRPPYLPKSPRVLCATTTTYAIPCLLPPQWTFNPAGVGLIPSGPTRMTGPVRAFISSSVILLSSWLSRKLRSFAGVQGFQRTVRESLCLQFSQFLGLPLTGPVWTATILGGIRRVVHRHDPIVACTIRKPSPCCRHSAHFAERGPAGGRVPSSLRQAGCSARRFLGNCGAALVWAIMPTRSRLFR